MDALALLMIVSFMITWSSGIKDVPQYNIEAFSGETIYLPCNISTYKGDEVVLILWYRDDKGTPIYSVDIRDGISTAIKRWSDETVFGERAFFMFDKEPGTLSIQNLEYTDTGVYRCRVDFLKAQTRNSKIKLTVIVPPERIIIRDEKNKERSTVVGPYNEGDVITLKCEVYGGKPIPKLNWYRDGTPVISESNIVSEDSFVQSKLTIGPLGREDLNSRLTCKASNHPSSVPIETEVQVDMNFSPLNIRLLGARQPLSAGRRYDLLCQSAGSRPPAVITWWIDGLRLEKTTETTSSNGNQTTSSLSIILSKSDSGKYLSCKAYNHAVPSEPLEDGWKLVIQYIPETFVQLGSSLDPNSIREGSDVYFDCLVVARPSVYRIDWRHNGHLLPHNISQGVIISNHSLVLQGVTRNTAGNYTCVGYNAEGEGISPPFVLNILYAPTCAPNQQRVYGVAKQEDAKIKCTVDANPPEVDFMWTFNNSAESIDVTTNHVTHAGTSSVVSYTPLTELDYGTLLCSASNKIGRQRVPCIFHIIAAGRPDQVHNCTLSNLSMTSLTITCSDGFSGGLSQYFILELREAESNEIKANITSTVSRFTVSSLTPGSVYELSIYAVNSKGKSDPTVLSAAMLRMPEKQLTSEPAENPTSLFEYSPLISLALGLSLVLLVAASAIILALRIPCNSNGQEMRQFSIQNISGDDSPCLSIKSSCSKEVDGNEIDDRNPDVVPEATESDDQIELRRQRQHISTIDANRSPTRRFLVHAPLPQDMCSGAASRLTISNVRNSGYYAISNGSVNSSLLGPISTNTTPCIYSNTIAQCTFPRHLSRQMWSAFGCAVAGNENTQRLSSSQQIHLQPSTHVPASQDAEFTPVAVNTSGYSKLNGTIALQYMRQNQKWKSCVSASNNNTQETENSTEEIMETPPAEKRESTV